MAHAVLTLSSLGYSDFPEPWTYAVCHKPLGYFIPTEEGEQDLDDERVLESGTLAQFTQFYLLSPLCPHHVGCLRSTWLWAFLHTPDRVHAVTRHTVCFRMQTPGWCSVIWSSRESQGTRRKWCFWLCKKLAVGSLQLVISLINGKRTSALCFARNIIFLIGGKKEFEWVVLFSELLILVIEGEIRYLKNIYPFNQCYLMVKVHRSVSWMTKLLWKKLMNHFIPWWLN